MQSLTPSRDSSARPLPTLEAIRLERDRRAAERTREDIRLNADLIRERSKTLSGFIREAWHVLEPTKPYVHGWHIDAVSEHLQAITEGRINRLLVNEPPGTMKSLNVSVFWPAWEWGPINRPDLRYLATSYAEHYVKRDSRRMRDLVASDWYQSLWGDHVKLTRLGEMSFANTAMGFREGVPFQSLTSGRGDRVIIDDPHSTETAESEAERERTTRIFRESVPTRLNDPKTSAIVVIMQRLHANDVSGQIHALNLGYEHLMLPMEFEPERRCRTSIGFSDPRTYEGELLFPERFPREVVDRDKVPMGTYAVAGQFQQRPAPRIGGMFQRGWFEIVPAAPADLDYCRGWDLAATKDSNRAAWTVGVRLGRRRSSGILYVTHVARMRGSAGEVECLIKSTASQDGPETLISLPQDPGQAGKAQAQYLVGQLLGYRVKSSPETGDKATRAEPVSAQAEAGNIKLVRGPWNEPFLEEISMFPSGEYKDQVDALSRAFAELVKPAASPRIRSL